jgi:hypothetical protein
MKKTIIAFVIGLVVLFIAAVVIAGFSLDGIVKRGIQTIGPKLTQVDLKLDKVRLSLFSGSGRLDGLIVGDLLKSK